MTIKQISVFLQNKPNAMAKFVDALSKNKIDMRALSLAEASDFGIVRVIVDDVYNAMQILKEEGYICSANKVLAVAIPDEPGGLAKVIQYLGNDKLYVPTEQLDRVQRFIGSQDTPPKLIKLGGGEWQRQ